MPDQENPNRRGRRDPELAAALIESEDIDTDDYGQSNAEQTFLGLYEGDTLVAKVAFSTETPLGEAWTTFGATTRIGPSEDTDSAFDRLAGVVNNGVVVLAEDLVDKLNDVRDRAVEKQRSHRITRQQ